MDCDLDRNPSPPKELLDSDKGFPDKLGDSVFSKHWLFQTLIRIIEAVNVSKENGESSSSPSLQQETSSESDGVEREQEMDIVELDPALEDDACTLWDMSANRDVAHFLQEFRVAEIFLEVIEKTRSPRLLEIVVGILGNIASFNELCVDVSQNNSLLRAVARLSGSSDAPTVIQVLRLIHTGVVNKNTSKLWIDVTDVSFMENLSFILQNSLNGEVLKRGLQLLYYLLDIDDQLCTKWGKENEAKTVMEAGKQLNSLKNFEALDEFWMVLNLLCLCEDNIGFLNVFFTDVFWMFYDYMMAIEDYEDTLPPVHRVTSVAAAISASSTFLRFEKAHHELFSKVSDNSFVPFLFKMLKSICESVELDDIKSRNVLSDNRSSDGCPHSLERSAISEREKPDSCLGSVSFSGSVGARGRKIPSYNSCLTKTVADCDNLLLLKESLDELCAILNSLKIQKKN